MTAQEWQLLAQETKDPAEFLAHSCASLEVAVDASRAERDAMKHRLQGSPDALVDAAKKIEEP